MAAHSRITHGALLRLGTQIGKLEIRPRHVIPLVQQVRFKKGEGRRRMADSVETNKTPKVGKWMQGFTRKVKNVVEDVTLADLKPEAVDNVWISKYYQPSEHSLVDAAQMHREFCQPAMLNNPTGFIHLSMLLDLRTKKKTKFMGAIKKTVVPPHIVDESEKNRVMVLVKDEELQVVAEKLGVELIGGTELLKKIEKGEIRRDEFDHVVAHVDMLQELGTARKFLREQFPSKKTGNVGVDIGQMVKFFQHGVTYESEILEEALGQLTVKIGRLDMTDEQLMENFDAYIEAISSHRSPSLGQFITKAVLTCPPSPEKFIIQPSLLRPANQRTKKQEVLKQDEEEPETKEQDSDDEETLAVSKG